MEGRPTLYLEPDWRKRRVWPARERPFPCLLASSGIGFSYISLQRDVCGVCHTQAPDSYPVTYSLSDTMHTSHYPPYVFSFYQTINALAQPLVLILILNYAD